ncbi:MAG: ABC transporter substrate-binding protein [Sphingobacteriales bacterium]
MQTKIISFAGNNLPEELQERVDIIRHKLKFSENKPTVACIERMEPLTLSDNPARELVAIAGGIPVSAEADEHSPNLPWDEIRLSDPDILIIMPRGFPIERTLSEIDLLLRLTGFDQLKAVKNNQVYIADGNRYFNHSGPRIVDSIEILAEIINPKQFIFGYEGDGWIKFAL